MTLFYRKGLARSCPKLQDVFMNFLNYHHGTKFCKLLEDVCTLHGTGLFCQMELSEERSASKIAKRNEDKWKAEVERLVIQLRT